MRLSIAQYNDLIDPGPLDEAPGPDAGDRQSRPDERRAMSRQPVRKAAHLLPLGPSGKLGRATRPHLTDATPLFVGLLHAQSLPEGSGFILHFERLGDQAVSIRCVVRSCTVAPDGLFRIGAEFVEIVACGPPEDSGAEARRPGRPKPCRPAAI